MEAAGEGPIDTIFSKFQDKKGDHPAVSLAKYEKLLPYLNAAIHAARNMLPAFEEAAKNSLQDTGAITVDRIINNYIKPALIKWEETYRKIKEHDVSDRLLQEVYDESSPFAIRQILERTSPSYKKLTAAIGVFFKVTNILVAQVMDLH